MGIRKRGKYHYGDRQADIRDELRRYSEGVTYLAEHFADARCGCGGTLFRLEIDDTAGAAVRTCDTCGKEHALGDSAEYLEGADLQECACPCGAEVFEITAGVALYEDSEDVKWIYIGCRCQSCGLTACYGDWKNEYNGYQQLLRQV